MLSELIDNLARQFRYWGESRLSVTIDPAHSLRLARELDDLAAQARALEGQPVPPAARVVPGDPRVIDLASRRAKALGAALLAAGLAIGIASSGSMIEVLSSDSGSWSILVTDATSRSCLIAAGQHWEYRPPAPPAAGTRS